jgi:hypothetical protein
MKKTLRYSLLAVLASIVASLTVLILWYAIDGQPLPETNEFLSGKNFTSNKKDNGDWVFTPKNPNGAGIAIMTGALAKPKSYAKTAAFFADLGYRVWIPYDSFRLSYLSADRIAKELGEMPEQDWILLGHSMGGLTSLTVNSLMNEADRKVKGIVVWAGSMPTDFSSLKLPILFLTGTNDKMLPPEKLTKAKDFLPKETVFISIEGANHKNFSLYSHQFFDGEASIGHEQQIDEAHALTLPFIEKLTGQK